MGKINFHLVLPEWEESTTVAAMNKILDSLSVKKRKKLNKSIKKQAKLINNATTNTA